MNDLSESVAGAPTVYRRHRVEEWALICAGRSCGRCGGPAKRSLAAEFLCWDCSEATLEQIRARVMEFNNSQGVGLRDYRPSSGPQSMFVDVYETVDGVSRRTGQQRETVWIEPEPGPDEWVLRCNQCSATWIGLPGDDCPWCADRLADLLMEHESRAQ